MATRRTQLLTDAEKRGILPESLRSEFEVIGAQAQSQTPKIITSTEDENLSPSIATPSTPALNKRLTQLNEAKRRGLLPDNIDLLITKTQEDIDIGAVGKPTLISTQKPSEDRELTWSEVGIQALANTPESGINFVKDIYSAVRHPLETFKTTLDLSRGIVEKLIPGEQPSEVIVDAVIKHFSERYSSVKDIKNTIAKDPFGFFSDLHGVITAGASATGKLAKLAKIAPTSKVRRGIETVKTIGETLEPITIAGKIIKPAFTLGGSVGASILGSKFATGIGSETVKFAFDRNKAFLKTLQSDTAYKEVLRSSEGALDIIKNERTLDYINRLENIKRLKVRKFPEARKPFPRDIETIIPEVITDEIPIDLKVTGQRRLESETIIPDVIDIESGRIESGLGLRRYKPGEQALSRPGESIARVNQGEVLINKQGSVVTTKPPVTILQQDQITGQQPLKRLEAARLDKLVDVKLDIKPIIRELGKQLKAFRIKLFKDPVTGKVIPNMDRSTITRKARKEVATIIEDVLDWGTQEGDLSVLGFDALKRGLDDFYSESKNSRAMVTALRDKVKATIIKQVPEYSDMVKNYEISSKMISEIQQALSIGTRAAADTTLRKLVNTVKNESEIGLNLIKEMERVTGAEIRAEIGGILSKQWTPKTILGQVSGLGVLYYGISTVDPKLAALLASSSPRAVTGFVNILGIGYRAAKKAGKLAPPIARQAAFQTGRAQRFIEESPQPQQTLNSTDRNGSI